jgi:hypothetical protein
MRRRTVLVALGWSFLLSSIILQVLYVTPTISVPVYALLVLVSIMCGMLIVDLQDVVLSYFMVVLLSLLITVFMLGVMPSLTGSLPSGFTGIDLIMSSAVMMVATSTFPGVWVLCLLAGVLGGGIGEWIEPLAKVEYGGAEE